MSHLPIDGVSVVIAVFNEKENIEPLIAEVESALKPVDSAEIVVVDDGSTDGTSLKLQQISLRHPLLRIVTHKKNYGQSTAVMNGVRHSQFPWVITLDGDGQNDPKDFQKLFAAVNEPLLHAPLLVAGIRTSRNDTWVKRRSSKIANAFRQKLLGDDCPDSGCGLKLFQRQVFLDLPHFNHLHRFLPALFKRAGGHVINVPVNHRPRTRGASKYGTMNRLWVGIIDLFGVMWLLRRPCPLQNLYLEVKR